MLAQQFRKQAVIHFYQLWRNTLTNLTDYSQIQKDGLELKCGRKL